jgi:hypothetical protein
MRNKLNRIWAKKVKRSKNFVVLTDDESALNLLGTDPTSFNSMVMLTAQAQALRIFRKKLDWLIAKHDKEVEKFNRKGGQYAVSRAQKLRASSNTEPAKKKKG